MSDILLPIFSRLAWHRALRSCAHQNKQFVQPNCILLDACNCLLSQTKPGLVQVIKAHCFAGTTALDVMPQGATTAYAVPEVLYSLQLQFDPQVRRDQVQEYLWINRTSADWWSLDVVLFELLTGSLSRPPERGPQQTQT